MKKDTALATTSRTSLVLLLISLVLVVAYLHLIQSLAMRAYAKHAGVHVSMVAEILVVRAWWLGAVLLIMGLTWAVLATKYVTPRTRTIVNCCALLVLQALLMAHGIAVLVPLIGMSPSLQ